MRVDLCPPKALVTDGEADSGQEPVVLTEEHEDGLPSVGIAFTVHFYRSCKPCLQKKGLIAPTLSNRVGNRAG